MSELLPPGNQAHEELRLLPPANPDAVGYAPPHIRKTHTLSGHFEHHSRLPSAHLKYDRDIRVYLPPGYDTEPERHYPVLYMHDGNNLFDSATSFLGVEWQVDEHLERLIAEGELEPLIVVGVDNTPAREDEYTWTPMLEDGRLKGGQGPLYARFLVEELKPFIDGLYRTRPEREFTGVMGSSLGGLISFYLGLYYPQIYSRIGLISPSLWWDQERALEDVERLSLDLRLWVDIGTREGDAGGETVRRTLSFVESLLELGYQPGEDLAYCVDQGADHSEWAWSQRVGTALCFLFGGTCEE